MLLDKYKLKEKYHNVLKKMGSFNMRSSASVSKEREPP
jgi:hypothetical protein